MNEIEILTREMEIALEVEELALELIKKENTREVANTSRILELAQVIASVKNKL